MQHTLEEIKAYIQSNYLNHTAEVRNKWTISLVDTVAESAINQDSFHVSKGTLIMIEGTIYTAKQDFDLVSIIDTNFDPVEYFEKPIVVELKKKQTLVIE